MSSRPHPLRLAAGTGLGLGAALALTPAAQADVDTITVTSTADPGDANCATNGCTLREAIAVSDDADGTDLDTIVFQSGISGQIALTAGRLPVIDEPLTITGPGAGTLAVDGNQSFGILGIDSAPGADVTVSGLTLRDGDSQASGSAGINTRDADLVVDDVVMSGNRTGGSVGGAISVSTGRLTITDATISGNTATGSGGAIHAHDSFVTVERSTISGNEATGGDGGAIRAFYGNTTIRSSTISGNTASGAGGAIDSSYDGNPRIFSSTVAGNRANGPGGGLRFQTYGCCAPQLSNSIVADNTTVTGGNQADLSASNWTGVDASFSLVESPGNAGVTVGGAIIGLDPQLGPLAANGGPTATQKPGAGSPAVDKGSAAVGETADQRGLPRPFDSPSLANAVAAGADGADIGAVELQPGDFPVATPPATQPGFDLKAAIKRCKKKFRKGPKRSKCIKKAKAKA